MNNLFWSLFGYSPPQYADVIVSEQVYRIHNKTIVYVNKHNFTEATGYMLYSIYNVASIVILLNLLIAMMSTSFILVQVKHYITSTVISMSIILLIYS